MAALGDSSEHPDRVRARGTHPNVRRGRFGELEMQHPIARGGMSGVYLATDRVTGERVALKVLDPKFASAPEVVARLRAEHGLASRAKHPGLVEIRAARETDDGVPYLVMEYLDGETLAEIAEHEVLELSSIIAICAQIAFAVAALHAARVIHCDLKHDNVIVLRDDVVSSALATPAAGTKSRWSAWPRVKVIDFGVSRTVEEAATPAASIAGTPWYMAPEQWSGTPTQASDVYALGCMLYELTTGAPPFDGSVPELMLAHLEQRPSRPSWLRPMPIDLERIILRSLAKLPDERPTMNEMAFALADLVELGTRAVRQAG